MPQALCEEPLAQTCEAFEAMRAYLASVRSAYACRCCYANAIPDQQPSYSSFRCHCCGQSIRVMALLPSGIQFSLLSRPHQPQPQIPHSNCFAYCTSRWLQGTFDSDTLTLRPVSPVLLASQAPLATPIAHIIGIQTLRRLHRPRVEARAKQGA